MILFLAEACCETGLPMSYPAGKGVIAVTAAVAFGVFLAGVTLGVLIARRKVEEIRSSRPETP